MADQDNVVAADTATDTELTEIDFGNAKVPVPKAMAEAVVAWRDQQKAAAREAQERLGAIEAEKAAAAAAAAEAERKAQAAEAAKKGELDRAEQILTEKYRQREERLTDHLKTSAVRAMVAANSGLVKMGDTDAQSRMYDDITSQVKNSLQYDSDSHTLKPVGPDGLPILDKSGQPLSVDAFVSAWLDSRPWLKAPVVPAGSGAAGSGTSKGPAPTATQDEIGEMTPSVRADFFRSGGQVK